MIKNLSIIFFLILCGLTFNTYSQTNSEQARIFGVVTDKNGAVIPNVKITITAKNFRCELTSVMDGQYEIIVPPGTYDITANIVTFRKFKKKKVNINRQANFLLNIVLKFGKPIIIYID